ncbi:sulfatase-like hydrolase/transferase [Planctomycetes bacterium K23_9]|uniref:Sulfatase n=1 Tax=Stieleria marina TaxID=1930275 RepID=A0A517P108_9BACT|nr:Sulfatase [Planctomycetes bacterium K23_9]
MIRRPIVLTVTLFATALIASTLFDVAASAKTPNVIWISAEDISPHFGCYGDPHAITPNIDQLASEGVRYSHAFTAAGVCAPCRSSIITGFYQNSIGTHHMRCDAKLPAWLKPFPQLMQEAGYYCTNNSKTDYQFTQPSKKAIWDQCSSKAHWKNRNDDQPFFAVFNFTGCHESGIENEDKYQKVTQDLNADQRQDGDALTTLPPYYPDTPIVREDWKRNYELITAMDAWAGDLIQELKDADVYDDTIIFFWSDHGVGLPRAKRWLYDSGTRVPLVVRIPDAFQVDGQGRSGTVDDRLIDTTDFGQTVLNLAGVDLPERSQGQPFLGKDLPSPRRYVYGARDRMDERYDIIRTVRDKRYRYVRNFEPLKPYYQYMNTPEKGATMREIRQAETAGKLSSTMALFSAAVKPVEELYDCESDPHEINNLADDPALVDKLAEMRGALKDWQNKIGDIGLIPEAEIEIQEESAGSRFAILHRGQDSASKLERLVDIATKASQGPAMLDDLLSALEDDDPSVRYWAATGIGNVGQDASSAQMPVLAALKDPSPSVRIAAARAAAKLGETEAALDVLKSELQSKHQWGRLSAAIVLDEMDDQAADALDDLKSALKNQPNKYIVRVVNRAVNELQGTDHVVP